jgi:glycine cleavage system aminomethyltransferase T
MENASIKIERRSPLQLPGKPEKTRMRDHWPVVLEYADEGRGPWIVDLSHCARWDIQGRNLAAALPAGVSVPDAPGKFALHAQGLTGRSGHRQAFLWLFDAKAAAPSGTACTEITEGTLCFALLGRNVFQITEKLTSLDLGDPKRNAPFLLMGPFSHITGQIVVLKNDPAAAAVLVACSRGFGHDILHAVLAAGEEFGLQPAGENRFMEKFSELAFTPVPSKPKASRRRATASVKTQSSGRSRSKKTAL